MTRLIEAAVFKISGPVTGRLRLVALALISALAGCADQGLGAADRVTVTIGEASFDAELAATPAERSRGLMYREELPEREGMLFAYPGAAPRSFWMKNTRVPLDIIYIGADREIVRVRHAVPCAQDPCPGYPSVYPAQYVLEINGGLSERLGIREGDTVSFAEGSAAITSE